MGSRNCSGTTFTVTGDWAKKSVQYLLQTSTGHVPRLFLDAPWPDKSEAAACHLQLRVHRALASLAWGGDTGGKPGRAEMLQALADHASSDQISLSCPLS